VVSGVTATSATVQTAVVGTAVAESPTVRVVDQNGAPMANVAVGFVVAGGGSVATPAATTDASGTASAGTWTLGLIPGPQSVTVSLRSITVQFTATAQPRAPTTVTAVSATAQQTAMVGTVVAQAPTVRVSDQTGQPLGGVTVTFGVMAGGGQVQTNTATTGPTGEATSGPWTLGIFPGANTVTATVAGLPPVSFNATGTPDPCSDLDSHLLDNIVYRSITSATCQLSGGYPVHSFSAHVPEARLLLFSMSSSAFDTWFEVYRSTGKLAAFNDDGAPGVTDSYLRVFASPGEPGYYLGASSFGANATGAFSLLSTGFAGNVNCQEYWAVPSILINDALGSSDCVSADGYFSDGYLVVLHPRQDLQVQLASTGFTGHLRIIDENLRVVSNGNAEGASHTSAMIGLPASATEPAFFYIEVGTQNPGESGRYSLALNFYDDARDGLGRRTPSRWRGRKGAVPHAALRSVPRS
jgi:hypothetical protein